MRGEPLLIVSVAVCSAVLAAPIIEDRRTFSDGAVQERWTWEGERSSENLTRKEWFHRSGGLARVEEYAGGVLAGRVATFDASGVLETEKHYAEGVLHGVDREWSGRADARWVEVERNYVAGDPHGIQLRRRDAETIELRHRYEGGRLHGRQEAWHPNGEQRYDLSFAAGLPDGEQRFWKAGELEAETSMFFVEGRPEGQQRYFINGDWRTEVWAEGRWREVRSWHVEGETPDRVYYHELEVVPRPYYGSAGDKGPPPPARALYFSIEKRRVVEQRHWANGTLKEEHDQTGDRRYRSWAENGQLVLEGLGNPSDRRGRWTAWRPDGTLHREEDWTGNRVGVVRTYDRAGRLREVETWNYHRTRWDITLYDGDVRIGEGEVRAQDGRYRWGTWTWFRPDGSVQRTEVYGHGPYSGNRPFVLESTEFTVDGEVRCSGGERELTCVEPDASGGSVELSVIALHRPRHGYEVYETKELAFRRLDIERKPLADGAVVVPVLDGEGLVRTRRRRNAAGVVVTVETWRRDGSRERVQGSGPAGSWVDAYDKQGRLQTIEEAFDGGAMCTVRLGEDGRVEQAWVVEADGSMVVKGQGRAAARRVAACPTWTRYPQLQD